MTQGTTKGIPIDTDGTLSSNSDALVPSQKAVVTYVGAATSGSFVPTIHDINGAYHNGFPLLPQNGGTGVNNGSNLLTIPATGTAALGTGAATRIAQWSGANTLEASTLIKTGAGVLTFYLDTGAMQIQTGTGTFGLQTMAFSAPSLAITPVSTNVFVQFQDGDAQNAYVSITADKQLTVSDNATLSGTNTGDQSGANPTASAGLTAVNGVATTFMRSDAAPALDVSINPVWTGSHEFVYCIGAGIAPSLDRAINSMLTGNNIGSSLYGHVNAIEINNTTTNAYALHSQVHTSAVSFTLGNAYGIYIDNPNKGAGSTITNNYGLYIAAQTAGGTLNYSIFTAGAGIVSIGDTTDSTSTANGAIVTAGGVGVAKALSVGTTIGVGVAPVATSGLIISNGTIGSSIYVADAGTNNTPTIIQMVHNSSDTPTTGFGLGVVLYLNSSTTDSTAVSRELTTWVDATHASRKARRQWTVYDTAEREGFRIEASGTAPMIGFLGAAAAARPTAYTQTYSTAARTITQTTMTDPATYGAGANGYSTAAQASAIHAEVIALRANMIVTQNVLNSVIDDLQAYGLLG